MKIKVSSSELNRIMKTITQCIDQRDITNKANIEVTHENNLLSIRAANGQYSAVMSTPILGGDGESFCIDGSMFARVCSMCNGETEISTDNQFCTIKGAGRTRLPIVNAKIPDIVRVEGNSATLPSDLFTRCLNGVSYAVSPDQNRIQLTGILTEVSNMKLKMVALDGFQMSIETATCTGDGIKMIVPGSFMKLVSQAASGEDITIRTDGSRIEASTDCMILSCGLIGGEYVDYDRITPKEFKTECLVNVEELRNAVKSGSVINNKQNLVKLEISSDKIKIMNNSEEADFEAEVPCNTHGDGLKIAFNLKYLMNTIAAVLTNETVMKFNSPISPCVIQGKEEDGFRLILPVRVQG